MPLVAVTPRLASAAHSLNSRLHASILNSPREPIDLNQRLHDNLGSHI